MTPKTPAKKAPAKTPPTKAPVKTPPKKKAPAKKTGPATNQRPPTSSGIVDSPSKGKIPPATQNARKLRTTLLHARLKREMRHNPPGLGSNSGTNTGGVSEGGMVSPYTLT